MLNLPMIWATFSRALALVELRICTLGKERRWRCCVQMLQYLSWQKNKGRDDLDYVIHGDVTV
jgi:hypothetical protein